MDYTVSPPSSTYLHPNNPSAWMYPGFLGPPFHYDPTHVPGCTISAHPSTPSPPVPSSFSIPAPMPTGSSHQGSRQIVTNTRERSPSEASHRRNMRRKRQHIFELLETWAGLMATNYTQIPTLDALELIKPFGQIAHASLTRFWTLPQVDPVAYVLHCSLAGEYATSYAIYIPSLCVNLLPFAIASLIDPSIEEAEPDEVTSPELGTLHTMGILSLNTRLGNSQCRVNYFASVETQVLVLGSDATRLFGLSFCPLRLQVVTAIGQPLNTIRIPFRWLMTP